MTRYVEEVDGPARRADQPPRTPGRTGTRPPAPRWWRRPWVVPLVVLNAAFLLFVLPPYLGLDPSRSRVVLNEDFPAHYAVVVAHIFFGTIALVTVCLQVWPWLRQRYPAVHRTSGRLYVIAGAVPSALLGLALMPFAAVPVGLLGSALAAVGWIVTSLVGLHMARRRRFTEHRRWMAYSIAFALQTLWGRIFVLTSALTGVTVNPIVLGEAAGWLSWLVNLAVAHWWVRRTARPPRPAFS
ncbi:DUF2306 domain-containing protein [Micromonospora sp. WMMD558]|uniref:DUF2306 domain-containing protein n=1 Tax=Micromonospora sp. WMMD558 TaxID=3403462 RepID=UPI003BF523CD